MLIPFKTVSKSNFIETMKFSNLKFLLKSEFLSRHLNIWCLLNMSILQLKAKLSIPKIIYYQRNLIHKNPLDLYRVNKS